MLITSHPFKVFSQITISLANFGENIKFFEPIIYVEKEKGLLLFCYK